MSAETLGEAVATDLAVKAVIWGPSIAGAILLGPVGLLVGAAVSVALVASGGDNSPQDKSLER
jgi:hypothetical protein